MIQSIFAKLMMRFTILVLLIIFLLSISLTYFFQYYYLDAKESEFITVGQKIATLTGAAAERGSEYFNAAMTQILRSAPFLDEQIMITDREGAILAATAGERWLGVKLDWAAVAQVLNGKIVAVRGQVKYFDEPILLIAIPVYVQGQVGGAVFVYNTIAGISGIILKLRQLLFFIGLGIMAFAVILSYQFSRTLSNPIHKLGAAAIAMSEGDYNVRVTVKGEDEISKLAHNFNILGEKLGDFVRLQREFVANVSHELKTPLTSIRGFVKALRDGVFDEEDSPEEYCNIIMNEVDRMNRLVAELLDLSQIESGIVKFRTEPFDLRELTQHTVSSLTPILARGDYKVEIDMPDDLGTVLGDSDRIGQVLINLIRNAIKHSEPGSVVHIHAFAEDTAESDMVKVEVEDEGCGIPAEELENIWHRFHKVDKARTRGEEEGTGLGLAIVREIIERHGGKVGVESTVGTGSVFSFTLKRATAGTELVEGDE